MNYYILRLAYHKYSSYKIVMPSDVMPQDENFLSFDEIFEELNYRQAQRTLRDIVSKMDLSERERRGLE